MVILTLKLTAIMLAIHGIGNVLLLLHAIFPLLEKDALTMSHIDPSIIIDTAIPIPDLAILVICSLVWNVIYSILNSLLRNSPTDSTRGSSRLILNFLPLVGAATILVHSLLILMGLHPAYFPKQTIFTSFYIALNSICPAPILFGEGIEETHSAITQKQIEVVVKEGFFRIVSYLTGPLVNENQQKRKVQSQQSRSIHIQQLHQFATFGASAGMTITAILRILDHGLQIQRHPMPILLGFTWGRCVGLFIGILTLAFCKKSESWGSSSSRIKILHE
ncbi:hypothetical protein ACHAW6_005908 [Cyclotella cf. meneghiniana]